MESNTFGMFLQFWMQKKTIQAQRVRSSFPTGSQRFAEEHVAVASQQCDMPSPEGFAKKMVDLQADPGQGRTCASQTAARSLAHFPQCKVGT